MGGVGLLQADRADRAPFERTVGESCPWDCVIDMICSDPADASSLARACRGRVGQLIFCSTTNVYPKPADRYPVTEDHRLGAAFKNGIDKTRCEEIHREAERDGAFGVTIVRPGHTYGETGAVLHSLGNTTSYLDRIRHGRPIVVHGDGQGLWSALHAEDVGRVFAAAAGNPLALGKTYNATGEEWMTWAQYNARVAAALDAPPPPLVAIPTDVLVAIAPGRAAQAARSFQYPGIYDMSAARRDLGFRQTVPFTDGVRRTIEWIETHEGIAAWSSDPEYDRIIEAWGLMTAGAGSPEPTGPSPA